MLKNGPQFPAAARAAWPPGRGRYAALACCLLAIVWLGGCVPKRQASAVAFPPPDLACPSSQVNIGKLDDPAHVFCSRAPSFTTVTVTATAYLATRGKRKRPSRGAWGDVLDPGANIVAVSADLDAMGLTRGAKLRIEGLPGEFTVLDRMHPRLTRTIDVFFGHDREAARHWGRRTLTISFEEKPQDPAAP